MFDGGTGGKQLATRIALKRCAKSLRSALVVPPTPRAEVRPGAPGVDPPIGPGQGGGVGDGVGVGVGVGVGDGFGAAGAGAGAGDDGAGAGEPGADELVEPVELRESAEPLALPALLCADDPESDSSASPSSVAGSSTSVSSTSDCSASTTSERSASLPSRR